jgi:hypothetical protein
LVTQMPIYTEFSLFPINVELEFEVCLDIVRF